MRTIRCTSLALLGLVALLISPTGHAQVDPGIRLSLTLNQSSYLFNDPNDPIQVTINLSNVSGVERLVSRGLTAKPLHLQLVFTDPDGRPITTSQQTTGGPDAPPADQLLIGDRFVQVEAVERLAAGAGVNVPVTDAKSFYVLPKTGFYSVKAYVSFTTYPAIFRTEPDGTEFARLDTETFAGVIESNVVPFALTADADGDGFAFPVADSRISAHPLPDCNDANAGIHPGAPEVLNGIDDDCNPATPDDPVAPVTTATVAPTPNGNGWNKTTAIVTLNATDVGSGVQLLSYALSGATTGSNGGPTPTTSIPLSAEGTTTIAFSAKDQAGNQEALKTALVRIDKTAPIVTTPASLTANATSAAGAVVTYTATATDNLDPAPTVTCAPPSGSAFPIGTTTVNCTGTDQAGNSSAQQSFGVTVKSAATQITDLKIKVNGLPGVSANLKSSLTTKLDAAQQLLAQGNIVGACGKLKDFIQQVQGQSGKGLTVAQATALLADANRIKIVIGCP
jgi:hypothetical protein